MQSQTLDHQTVAWLVSTLMQFNILSEAIRDQQFFFFLGNTLEIFQCMEQFFFGGVAEHKKVN
jgi:hypothetical protein